LYLTRYEATGVAHLNRYRRVQSPLDFGLSKHKKAKDYSGMLLKALNTTLFAECGPRKLARWMWLFGKKT